MRRCGRCTAWPFRGVTAEPKTGGHRSDAVRNLSLTPPGGSARSALSLQRGGDATFEKERGCNASLLAPTACRMVWH